MTTKIMADFQIYISVPLSCFRENEYKEDEWLFGKV